MKTIQEIKTDIDVLVRKQGNQGALQLGDVLDDIVDIVQIGFQEAQNTFQDINNTLAKFKAQITDVATFHTAVPNTATEIFFAFLGEMDLTGYTKSGSVGKGIDVYANGTKYAIISAKIICAPENSAEFFNGYSALTSLDLSNFDTSNVTSFHRMFLNCSGLTSLDVSNFDTSNATNFGTMFRGCRGLTSLDVSNFDTAKATTFQSMFDNCSGLTSLDLSNFDTSNATTFQGMFGNCSGLTSLDLSNFDTSNATTFQGMFSRCSGLTSLDVSNFDTANATSFESMFFGCSGLTSLDVSNFDTAKATTFESMFGSCSGITALDLSNFDTAKATTFAEMFDSCSGLTTIIAKDWRMTVTSNYMFNDCTSLVGGNGTTYNSSHINAAYAHIDVAGNPGYFTAPA